MNMLVYFGCDTDTTKIVKYTTERTYGFPNNKKNQGEHAPGPPKNRAYLPNQPSYADNRDFLFTIIYSI